MRHFGLSGVITAITGSFIMHSQRYESFSLGLNLSGFCSDQVLHLWSARDSVMHLQSNCVVYIEAGISLFTLKISITKRLLVVKYNQLLIIVKVRKAALLTISCHNTVIHSCFLKYKEKYVKGNCNDLTH